MSERLKIGFLPLVDAALPILAHEHGFAAEQGLALEFVRDLSWATVLDRLLYGHSDAAHMLAPLAIATTLGIGRPARSLSVPFVLGLNGNAITVSNALADRIQPEAGLGNAVDVGARLKTAVAGHGRKPRFGVVHRHSSHNYMLRYWLAACGVQPDRDVEIVTIAPPFAADALAAEEIDGICVGEPWSSVAVERGAGRIVLTTAQIWRRGVEKVLAVPTARLEEKRGAIERLVIAMRKAGEHFVDPANWETNAAILARTEYVGADPALILRAISDRLRLVQGGALVHFPDFMFQYREAANFPWVSQAAWLYAQMVRWEGMGFDPDAARTAMGVFRPDVYRAALTGRNSPLPGASSKVEGGIGMPLGVGAAQGTLVMSPDRFFDGKTFDPERLEDYLASLP
ncbi:ABC transporter substrate-binding protein [Croceicoccus sp. BE223]|uniref:ABC transporter substrate-binding protein n=1 Tax=Croceicoccus sp. BE223 TaxID=2817716 RepID=UPI002858493C|nr:ABC transporter substrate-binding protein [Croceicoccus sp. BE223]MDR7101220.1 NitT/TauT family transport system ATP-binding protein [Croceicoccus sp. BE223]